MTISASDVARRGPDAFRIEQVTPSRARQHSPTTRMGRARAPSRYAGPKVMASNVSGRAASATPMAEARINANRKVCVT